MRLVVFFFLGLFSSKVLAVDEQRVLQHYSDVAYLNYSEALSSAKTLLKSVEKLAAKPTPKTLSRAKQAWLDARISYQQSEVFRFGNPIVDDWEGRVNAWPLDEGLIDYVDDSYGSSSVDNPLRSANIIGTTKIKWSGKLVDTSSIDAALLTDTFHEADGVEANVAIGYHAIEFLLWGQDLNGTQAGAGIRPASDFDRKNCTNGNCERRVQYLLTTSDLLVEELAWMVKQWQSDGAARVDLLAKDGQGIAAILTGMGSLSYGELAGERIKLGLLLHDPEEEHDCFSDNTHNSHYYNIKGIQNVYLGRYRDQRGKQITGPSLSQLLSEESPKLDKQLRLELSVSLAAAKKLIDSANNGVAYDQLIAEDNGAGNAKVQAVVDALLAQTKTIRHVGIVLGIDTLELEGSDSLEASEAVFK